MSTTLANNIEKHNWKRIWVTGGLGFIGSNLIKKLNDYGFYDIDIIDEMNENNQRIATELGYARFHDRKKSFHEIRYSSTVMPSFFFHLGAVSSTKSDFQDCQRWNYSYTRNLIDHWLRHDAGGRLVIASSAAVYQNDFSEENVMNLRPKSNYAISKLLIDKELSQSGDFNKGILSIRPFNAFGKYEFWKNDMASYIFQSFQKIKNGANELFVFKVDGKIPSRDFISVDDAVEKILALTFGEYNGIYNVGNGVSVRWDDLAEIIINKLAKLFQKPIKLIVKDIELERMGKNYQIHTCSENTKVNAAIGSKNKTFEEVKSDIENYLDWLYNNSSYYLD